MATNRERKEETRQRMGQAATHGFRAHGFAGIGVDGIAREAGVTSGAFYAHFGSKDGAFAVGLELGLEEVMEAVPRFQKQHGEAWMEAFVNYYLGKAHREDLACGCAMTTLGPEVVRAEAGAKAIYEQKMSRIVELMALGLAGGTVAELGARAWAVISVLTGGLTASRAVHSEALKDEIARSVTSAALDVAGATKVVDVENR